MTKKKSVHYYCNKCCEREDDLCIIPYGTLSPLSAEPGITNNTKKKKREDTTFSFYLFYQMIIIIQCRFIIKIHGGRFKSEIGMMLRIEICKTIIK